jgi:tRNA A37 threonylcarbamoyladenosine dehydratase
MNDPEAKALAIHQCITRNIPIISVMSGNCRNDPSSIRIVKFNEASASLSKNHISTTSFQPLWHIIHLRSFSLGDPLLQAVRKHFVQIHSSIEGPLPEIPIIVSLETPRFSIEQKQAASFENHAEAFSNLPTIGNVTMMKKKKSPPIFLIDRSCF